MSSLKTTDPEVAKAIYNETKRQSSTLELIASENFVSDAVLEAQGSIMTNKYAEGYPQKRYYGGCEFVDVVEDLAIKRAKEIFGSDHANVQPHSGSQANMAVYFLMLDMGDTILGMDLSHGGHLTHGSPVNFSGKYFNIISYGVSKKTETIDYEYVEKLALEENPKLIIAGASAYPRIIDFAAFKKIADKVNAYLMVDMAHFAGLVAAKIYPSPIPYADFVTTTTHKTLRGPRGGMILCKEEYAKRIDKMIFPGIQGGPMMHVIAAKAVAFKEAMAEGFNDYQKQIVENAKALASELDKRGFRLVSGGTDTHLLLLDLTNKGITGKDAEKALDIAGITVNKNAIPFDKQSPFITSGIRIGTPAITTRGMKEPEMKLIAEMITKVLANINDIDNLKQTLSMVTNLCNQFPLYANKL